MAVTAFRRARGVPGTSTRATASTGAEHALPRLVRVLVVEDDVSFARLLCRALEHAGIETQRETTAETAIVALSHEKFDCAVVDIILPGSSGVYVTHAIRRLPQEERPEVVVVTSADLTMTKAIDRSVVRAIVIKPLNVTALTAFVKALGEERLKTAQPA